MDKVKEVPTEINMVFILPAEFGIYHNNEEEVAQLALPAQPAIFEKPEG